MELTFKNKKDRLLVSFSGGKTSAYMMVRIFKELRHQWSEITVCFANTGQEHEKTLVYVRDMAALYGIPVVWLEAVPVMEHGVGTGHKIVSFETAARKGEPFRAAIEKFGIPNSQFPHCNRELKLRPITSYLRSIGWDTGSYNTAIGIRADEADRMSANAEKDGLIYPLVKWLVTKQDVLQWDREQPVKLGIPEHWGNCVWCWEKSYRKLATISTQLPEVFEFPKEMEIKHVNTGAGRGDRRFFRGRLTANDIFELARNPNFVPFVDGQAWIDPELDVGGSCGDSCEIGADSDDGQMGLF